MSKVKFRKREIDYHAAEKQSQEIIGNIIIRELICSNAQDDYANTSIVYDHQNEQFEDKLTDSINDYYKKLEAEPFIYFVRRVNNIASSLNEDENEFSSHVSKLNRNSDDRFR